MREMEQKMAKKYRIAVNEKLCKQCGICSGICPRKVLEQELGKAPHVKAQDQCIGCKMCQMCCPDFAIEVEVE
jgi:2-oxoglutarate ferredoxin oxidoreductase subunit delta